MRPVLFTLVMFVLLLTGCTAPPAQPAGEFLRVPFPELIANAEKYNGIELCTDGYYGRSFEVSVLADSYRYEDERHILNPPYIWVESLPVTNFECRDEKWNSRVCISVICGKFLAGGQYGHMGGYPYTLEQIPLISDRLYYFTEGREAYPVLTTPAP